MEETTKLIDDMMSETLSQLEQRSQTRRGAVLQSTDLRLAGSARDVCCRKHTIVPSPTLLQCPQVASATTTTTTTHQTYALARAGALS